MEFPDAKRDDTGGTCADKYKRFVVNYTPEAGYYAGGVFRFEFDVRDVPDYPEKPPKVTCLTKVWHPNISLDGRVCHNYLQANEAYVPAVDTHQLLVFHISFLLSSQCLISARIITATLSILPILLILKLLSSSQRMRERSSALFVSMSRTLLNPLISLHGALRRSDLTIALPS